MEKQFFDIDEEKSLSKNKFKREGFDFGGWTTYPEGVNARYKDEETVKNLTKREGEIVDLYAFWVPKKVKITFYDSREHHTTYTYKDYAVASFFRNTPWHVSTSAYFDGWYTSPSGGERIWEGKTRVPAWDTTYYAHWSERGGSSESTPANVCIVRFDTVGGIITSGDEAWAVLLGNTIGEVGELPTATRRGSAFVGWFTAAEGGTQVTAETIVAADVTYYAHWAEILPDPVPPDPVNPDPVNPEPVDPDPIDPDPVNPDPVDPEPVDPDPVNPDPVNPGYEVINATDIRAPYFVPKAVTAMGAAYDGNGAVVGIVELKLGKVSKGKGKVSGSFVDLDGKKHTIKGPKLEGIDGNAPIAVALDVKDFGAMNVTIGGELFAGSLGNWHVQSANVGGNWTGRGATVTVDANDLSMFAGTVLEDLLPNEEQATVAGGKWTFAKAASVKWSKPKNGAEPPKIYDGDSGKGLFVDKSKGTNLSAMKLSYTPKKGTFKGSFKVYALEGTGKSTKLKKYTVKVAGLVVDGVGYGAATSKKPVLTWSVTVR